MFIRPIKNENSQFSAEKDTQFSILKFTSALTFYIMNSLFSPAYDTKAITCLMDVYNIHPCIALGIK